MNGNTKLKFSDAKQARDIYNYKNIKRKLYRTNTAILYNKICRQKQLTPSYINIRIKGKNLQCQNTLMSVPSLIWRSEDPNCNHNYLYWWLPCQYFILLMMGAWHPKYVENVCSNKICILLHHVGVLFNLIIPYLANEKVGVCGAVVEEFCC